jgi:hypothetical protein
MRQRILGILFLAVCMAAVVVSWLSASPTLVEAGPIQPGATIQVSVATPAALSSATGSYAGARAWVKYQGEWNYSATCPSAPDGVTIVYAGGQDAGQLGCWVRNSVGGPGAGSLTTWYVDSSLGNNANDCQAPGAAPSPGGHGACADPQEIVRRFGSQPVVASPTIYMVGDFSGASYVLNEVPGIQYQQIIVACTRTYTGWRGTVASVQQWDAGAHLEGQVAVVPVDGGASFNNGWTTADAGIWLEDTTAADTGGTGILGIPVGTMVDAGVFYSSLGAQVQSFTPGVVTPGDSVRAYTITPISTASSQTFQINGGVWLFEDCQIGSATHTVPIGFSGSTATGVEFDSCSVNGLDVYSGSEGFAYGSYVRGNAHFYGHGAFIMSTMFDGIESRIGGYVELSGWNLVGSVGIAAGNDGAGQVQIDTGPTAVIGYSSPALQSYPGGNVNIQAPFWARNSVGNAPAVKAWSGSSPVTYTTGNAPAYVGTLPTAPWLYGGTGSDAGLPLYNTANGAGIVVQQ